MKKNAGRKQRRNLHFAQQRMPKYVAAINQWRRSHGKEVKK